MKETLTYDDVLLVPQYSDIESRSEVSLACELDKQLHFSLPVVSSPMDTVTEVAMAIAMHEAGGLGIVHRYNTIEEQVGLVHSASMEGNGRVGAAVGVTGDFEERACAIYDAGARVLCIDVAHGHHALVRNSLETLRRMFGNKVHLMAGNVATRDGFEALSDWGADSVRCNIGGGSICSTRIQTGHGVPGLQTILDCARSDRETKIIADGGIRSSGDVVKAIAAGADFVMVGALLAGSNEAPGLVVTNQRSEDFKIYRGMASFDAQKDWRGKLTSAPEGVSTPVPCKGPVEDILYDLAMGLRSGLSYSGARNISEFQAKAKFIRQTNASQLESDTHILKVRSDV